MLACISSSSVKVFSSRMLDAFLAPNQQDSSESTGKASDERFARKENDSVPDPILFSMTKLSHLHLAPDR